MVHGSVECVDSECRGYAFDVMVMLHVTLIREEKKSERKKRKSPPI